jgi:hypothetical protein
VFKHAFATTEEMFLVCLCHPLAENQVDSGRQQELIDAAGKRVASKVRFRWDHVMNSPIDGICVG